MKLCKSYMIVSKSRVWNYNFAEIGQLELFLTNFVDT